MFGKRDIVAPVSGEGRSAKGETLKRAGKGVVLLLQVSPPPAVNVSRVQEVQLAPWQFAQGCRYRCRRRRLGTKTTTEHGNEWQQQFADHDGNVTPDAALVLAVV